MQASARDCFSTWSDLRGIGKRPQYRMKLFWTLMCRGWRYDGTVKSPSASVREVVTYACPTKLDHAGMSGTRVAGSESSFVKLSVSRGNPTSVAKEEERCSTDQRHLMLRGRFIWDLLASSISGGVSICPRLFTSNGIEIPTKPGLVSACCVSFSFHPL